MRYRCMSKNRVVLIVLMSNIDYLSLDGRALTLFVTVMETGSVTAAAERLGITQSAVSHQLDRLRTIFKDPLFIRSGRGITPTRRAEQLEDEARALLLQLQQVVRPAQFDPHGAVLNYRIGANDFQRDIVLAPLYRTVSQKVGEFNLTILPAEKPTAEVLRNGEVDLIISPMVPDHADLMMRRLYQDRSVCFYDPDQREAPRSVEDFDRARYISLTFLQGQAVTRQLETNRFDLDSRVSLRVANFSGLATFLKGTELLAVAPSLLSQTALQGFASAPFPYASESLTMYLIWHQKDHQSPEHRWLREQIVQQCALLE